MQTRFGISDPFGEALDYHPATAESRPAELEPGLFPIPAPAAAPEMEFADEIAQEIAAAWQEIAKFRDGASNAATILEYSSASDVRRQFTAAAAMKQIIEWMGLGEAYTDSFAESGSLSGWRVTLGEWDGYVVTYHNAPYKYSWYDSDGKEIRGHAIKNSLQLRRGPVSKRSKREHPLP